MRLERQIARRWAVRCGLLIGSLFAPGCRIGYQELPDLSGAGRTSSGANAGQSANASGSANGGKGNAQGGSALSDAGTAGTTGGGLGSAGQEPNAGGEAPLGEGGAAGASTAGTSAGGTGLGGTGLGGTAGSGGTGPGGGMAGAGGSATTVCTATADCACVANLNGVYLFCQNKLTATDARTYCITRGMHLVRIDSQAEADMITNEGPLLGVFNGDGYVTIGASDEAKQGEWRWQDGTQFWQGGPNGTAVGGLYSSWFTASPAATGIKNCAGLLIFGSWQDRACTALEPFICER